MNQCPFTPIGEPRLSTGKNILGKEVTALVQDCFIPLQRESIWILRTDPIYADLEEQDRIKSKFL
jgi:hypothetical protein